MSDHTESDGANQSQRNETTPPDVYAVRITANRETFAKIMQQFELDIGCRRPQVNVNPDGTGTILVYATEERIRDLKAAGYRVEQGENVSALGRQRQSEVGQGDRFKSGRVAPRGLGQKSGGGKEGSTR